MPDGSRRILANHRRRQKRRGLARVEVQVPKKDAALLRAVARQLRSDDASDLRAQLAAATASAAAVGSILDLLACDLPDEAFEPMLQRDRRLSRPVDL
ncbi:MAG: hypothetical protein IT563_08930 [Alphaproteobacteria bacterium]|nr:hypothetical protein [Alphaproteobacteria bacterium]